MTRAYLLWRTFVLITLSLAAFQLAGQIPVSFDPPVPDSRSFVTATVIASSCYGALQASVDGSVINLNLQPGACGVAVPVALKAKLGLLAAGTWDVRVTGAPTNYTTKLVVRGVDPFRAVPSGGPTSGGNRVYLFNDLGRDPELGSPVTITFGDQVVKDIFRTGAGWFSFIAPPHAAGDIDVTVSYQMNATESKQYVTRAAYRYTDAIDDPYATEPLLFPIAYEGVGAYGSRWTTENTIHFLYWVFPLVSFAEPPCGGCPTTIDQHDTFERLDKVSYPAGLALRILRGTRAALAPSSRIRDLSRQAESAGVEIPVVSESGFRPLVTLENIPSDARFRIMLRVWSLAPVASPVATCLNKPLTGGNQPGCFNLAFSQPTANTLAFASVDLTPMLQSLAAADNVWLNLGDTLGPSFGQGRYWAMLSITNNDTQEVTIVTPQ